MTSVLPEEESKAAKMKQKLMNEVHPKEERRSFLGFSRENLSISQSDLEQGFNKNRFRPQRNTILSLSALAIALLCLGLQSWQFRCTVANTREIENLKRIVESLKHRLLEEDLLDKLEAFEEQLYAGESNEEDDTDMENADYDFNYDEENLSWAHGYPPDNHVPKFSSKPFDFLDPSSTIPSVFSSPETNTDRTTEESWETVHKTKHGEESNKSHKSHHSLEEKSEDQKNDTKQKRSAIIDNGAKDLLDLKTKRKRSVEEMKRDFKKSLINKKRRNKKRRMVDGEIQDTSVLAIPSKHSRKHNSHSFYQNEDEFLEQESNLETDMHRLKRVPRKYKKNAGESHHRKTIAVQYIGNQKDGGAQKRKRPSNGIFNDWEPSSWVNETEMKDYFTMDSEGVLTVHEAGLYLVYAQIHYHDPSPRVSFRLMVKNDVILQCSADSYWNRTASMNNVSQSCFSAQLIVLQKGDTLLLKETEQHAKYILFDSFRSFFGLIKLGLH